MRRRMHLLLLALPLVTCTQPQTGPTVRVRDLAEDVAVVDGTTVVMRFPTPPVYLIWVAEVIRCSGITPDSLPSYWVAQVPMFANRHGALGFYARESQRVVVGLGYETVAYVIRHETLHHLLAPYVKPAPQGGETFQQSQIRQHPAEYFGGRDSTGVMIHGKCQDLVFPSPQSPEAPQSAGNGPAPHS